MLHFMKYFQYRTIKSQFYPFTFCSDEGVYINIIVYAIYIHLLKVN